MQFNLGLRNYFKVLFPSTALVLLLMLVQPTLAYPYRHYSRTRVSGAIGYFLNLIMDILSQEVMLPGWGYMERQIVPFWVVVLSFAILYAILKPLTNKLPVFKQNKKAGTTFAIALSFMTVLGSRFCSWLYSIIGGFSWSLMVAAIVAIIILVYIAIAWLLKWVPKPQPNQEGKGGIEGIVIGKRNNNDIPIKEAKIVASGPTPRKTKTNSKGHYELENLDVGSYNVEASAPGYESKSKPVDVRANTTSQLNFELEPSTTPTPTPGNEATLIIHLLDSESKELIRENILVEIYNKSNNTKVSEKVTYNGTVTFKLAAGNYYIQAIPDATKSNYMPNGEDVSLNNGETKKIILYLKKKGSPNPPHPRPGPVRPPRINWNDLGRILRRLEKSGIHTIRSFKRVRDSIEEAKEYLRILNEHFNKNPNKVPPKDIRAHLVNVTRNLARTIHALFNSVNKSKLGEKKIFTLIDEKRKELRDYSTELWKKDVEKAQQVDSLLESIHSTENKLKIHYQELETWLDNNKGAVYEYIGIILRKVESVGEELKKLGDKSGNLPTQYKEHFINSFKEINENMQQLSIALSHLFNWYDTWENMIRDITKNIRIARQIYDNIKKSEKRR